MNQLRTSFILVKSRVALMFAILIGGAALMIAVGLSSCSGSGGSVTLFVSGDTRGYLEPCGCRRDQAGGLPGRLTLMRENGGPNQVAVDVGNLTKGDRPYDLLKLRYLLDGMSRIGYQAVNLGRREAGLDRQTLCNIIAENRVPFVSCNVLDKLTRAPLAEQFRTLDVAGMRIGITGIAEAPDDEVGPGVLIRPASEALAETLPRLKGSDLIVVLAFASQESIRSLAERFHEIGCILGGDVPQSSGAAETINRAAAFNVTDQGKVLGQLTFHKTTNGVELVSSQAYKVKDTIKPAAEMTSIIRDFKEKLKQQNVELATEEGLDPIQRSRTTADLYVGQQACASCHAEAHRVNFISAHTRAFETLLKKKSEFDPDCLRCHTVGYGARDGFINLQRTPALAGVQCENCHGRAGDHVKAMQAGRKVGSTFRPVTPNTCVKCHDKENSESFEYNTYWIKIAHGAN